MKLHDITEEWADDVKAISTQQTLPVFFNPKQSEFLELKKKTGLSGIRFIADNKNKKLYVFDGRILHHQIADRFNIIPDTDDAFFGEGEIYKAKLKVTKSFQAKYSDKKMLFGNIDKKWGWTKLYSDLPNWMKKNKKEK